MKDIFIPMIPVVLITFLGNLIFHELGHLLGGLLTGWKLIYLQLFHFAIVKGERFFKMKELRTFSFQCLMYPDSKNTGALIYTIGGCILNLVLGIMGLSVLVFHPQNEILWMYGWSFFVFGSGFFLMNGLPSTKRICNDMACYQLLKADNMTKQCHNAQLIIAKELFHGKTYHQIDEKLISLSSERADNDILAYQAILEYYYHLDYGNYDRMQKSLEKIDLNSPISREITDILSMERIYCDLLIKIRNREFNINEKKAEHLGEINKKLALHETRGDIHSIRVKAMYDIYCCFLENDSFKTLAMIESAQSNMKKVKVLLSGESLFCFNQLDQLQKFVV